jgi:hypothetical protein
MATRTDKAKAFTSATMVVEILNCPQAVLLAGKD